MRAKLFQSKLATIVPHITLRLYAKVDGSFWWTAEDKPISTKGLIRWCPVNLLTTRARTRQLKEQYTTGKSVVTPRMIAFVTLRYSKTEPELRPSHRLIVLN